MQKKYGVISYSNTAAEETRREKNSPVFFRPVKNFSIDLTVFFNLSIQIGEGFFFGFKPFHKIRIADFIFLHEYGTSEFLEIRREEKYNTAVPSVLHFQCSGHAVL